MGQAGAQQIGGQEPQCHAADRTTVIKTNKTYHKIKRKTYGSCSENKEKQKFAERVNLSDFFGTKTTLSVFHFVETTKHEVSTERDGWVACGGCGWRLCLAYM